MCVCVLKKMEGAWTFLDLGRGPGWKLKASCPQGPLGKHKSSKVACDVVSMTDGTWEGH